MRLLALSILTLSGLSLAQTGVPVTGVNKASAERPGTYRPTDAQVLAGSKALFGRFTAATSARDRKGVAALYHDSAVVVVERHSSDAPVRTLKLTGAQYKALAQTVPLTEAPDLYLNPTYTLLRGSIVQITAQRQSVSRGYTVPNILYVQPDTSGRFWIIGERAVQQVK